MNKIRLTNAVASEIVTGLTNGTLELYPDKPAKGNDDYQEMVNEIEHLREKYGSEFIIALAKYVTDEGDDVASWELDDYVLEHFETSDRTPGKALQEYAQQLSENLEEHTRGTLGDLFDALDNTDVVDLFPWEKFADSNSRALEGVTIIEIPATGNPEKPQAFVFVK